MTIFLLLTALVAGHLLAVFVIFVTAREPAKKEKTKMF